jgi:predicted transcriptional regulator
MDEYEIEDSVKFPTSCNSREDEGMFINSQDFFMTQECENKEEINFKFEEREKGNTEFEEREEVINLESDEDDDNKLEEKNKNGMNEPKEVDNFESNEGSRENNSNKSLEDNGSDERVNDNSDEKTEDESEEENESDDNDSAISDSSSEEIIPVRRSKKTKSTPTKKVVKRTKIKPSKKKKEIDKKEIDSSLEIKNNKKEREKLTKNKKETKNDKKKALKDSPTTYSSEKNNKYNLNSNELKIFNFFYNINRPVSGTELSLNFKGQIASTALQGICTTLESKSLLIIKVYSKSKMYMVNPNVFDMNKSEEYKVEPNNKIKLNEELKKKYSDINTELRSLKSMDTEEKIDEKIKNIKSRIEEVEGRMNLREDGLLVTKKEVEEYEKKMKKIHKIYKERSKIVQEILGMLCENMNVKKKELIEEMELDL